MGAMSLLGDSTKKKLQQNAKLDGKSAKNATAMEAEVPSVTSETIDGAETRPWKLHKLRRWVTHHLPFLLHHQDRHQYSACLNLSSLHLHQVRRQ